MTTMTATANECDRCGALALPGVPVDCQCDDTLTLFTMDTAAVTVILPTTPTETAEQFRTRIDAHAAETAAFFAGFTLNNDTESETPA